MCIRLEHERHEKLIKLSEITGDSMAKLIRMAIDNMLCDLGDQNVLGGKPMAE
jgi:predicted DNA-binding protein